MQASRAGRHSLAKAVGAESEYGCGGVATGTMKLFEGVRYDGGMIPFEA